MCDTWTSKEKAEKGYEAVPFGIHPLSHAMERHSHAMDSSSPVVDQWLRAKQTKIEHSTDPERTCSAVYISVPGLNLSKCKQPLVVVLHHFLDEVVPILLEAQAVFLPHVTMLGSAEPMHEVPVLLLDESIRKLRNLSCAHTLQTFHLRPVCLYEVQYNIG